MNYEKKFFKFSDRLKCVAEKVLREARKIGGKLVWDPREDWIHPYSERTHFPSGTDSRVLIPLTELGVLEKTRASQFEVFSDPRKGHRDRAVYILRDVPRLRKIGENPPGPRWQDFVMWAKTQRPPKKRISNPRA